jgi:hypothetical protein
MDNLAYANEYARHPQATSTMNRSAAASPYGTLMGTYGVQSSPYAQVNIVQFMTICLSGGCNCTTSKTYFVKDIQLDEVATDRL